MAAAVTSPMTQAGDKPFTDLHTHESYVTPQPVTLLPTKRVFDWRMRCLREATKLPREFLLASDAGPRDEVTLKVKIVGVNYQRDFRLLQSAQGPRTNVVPGNKIIGRIASALRHPQAAPYANSAHRYLVFPYSNCVIQRTRTAYCANCAQVADAGVASLTPASYSAHARHPCLDALEYGLSIDGGLQDYVRIKAPAQSLVRIPDNISLHDCCFALETALLVFLFVKHNVLEGKILVVLTELSRELNDVLLVLKHLRVDQAQVTILDVQKVRDIAALADAANYRAKFNHALLVDVSDDSVAFADGAVISTGLESTKLRYNMVFFDQYNPDSMAKNASLHLRRTDRTVHHFKLSFKDRLHAEELLQVIADLNLRLKEETALNGENRPSVTSIESAASTFSNGSIHLGSTSTTTPSLTKSRPAKGQKALRFRDDESIISPEPPKRLQTHYSWLWYEKDFDLCNDYDCSDDEDPYGQENESDPARPRKRTHSVKHMNRILHYDERMSRVCYANKGSRPVKINAFIFA